MLAQLCIEPLGLWPLGTTSQLCQHFLCGTWAQVTTGLLVCISISVFISLSLSLIWLSSVQHSLHLHLVEVDVYENSHQKVDIHNMLHSHSAFQLYNKQKMAVHQQQNAEAVSLGLLELYCPQFHHLVDLH